MKAYLELEMPNSCMECEFCKDWCRITATKQFERLECAFLGTMKNIPLEVMNSDVRHPQCPLQPKHTSKEVEEALEALYKINDIDWSDNPKIARYLGIEYIEEVALIEKVLKQALQPQVSEDVEELFKELEELVLNEVGLFTNQWKLYDKTKDQLKTKFAQMERENKELKGIIEQMSDANVVETKQNQQYKQLLDEIELTESENPKCTLVNGVMAGKSLTNLLKQLKSIGGKE